MTSRTRRTSSITWSGRVLWRSERSDDAWALRWTNAGHPPQLLITHDGRSRFLDEEHDHLLGTGLTRARTDTLTPLPPRSTLVLYTDGLIEGRVGKGTERLGQDGMVRMLSRLHVAGLRGRELLGAAVTEARELNGGELTDDVALVLLSRTSPSENH